MPMFFPWLLQTLSGGAFLILKTSQSGGAFPRPLSAEEEALCLARTAEGDLEARNKLVEHNLRLVSHIVKKYYAARDDYDDLVSIGTIGLIKGVCTFHPTKGARLATYAARCIENEILMYLRSIRKHQGEVSLSDPIDQGEDGAALSLMDVISIEDAGLEAVEVSDSCHRIYQYIFSHLDEREREIIILRYGLYGRQPLTQREIADQKGISRSYVSRLEKKALSKLRAVFEE